MNEQTPPTASPALAGKYKVVGVQPGRVLTASHGYVDLATVDLATADQLHAAKFPYLAKVEPDAPEAPAEEATEPEAAESETKPRKRTTPAS